MQYSDLQPKKPQHIALSFSGGGFLAASYTLGCISYMESVTIGGKKLTSLVKFISSASGGSITNLAYTESQRKGQPFEEFYRYLYGTALHGTLIVDHAFEIMKTDQYWKERQDKSRNLINAFSIAYDEVLFKKETFGIYWKPANEAVAEVCINATEFANGMSFRFQNNGLPGNRFLYFKKDAAAQEALKQIKLGDILACSACFPAGFEPFVFPDDFTYHSLAKNALQTAIKEDTRYSPDKDDDEGENELPVFGIMDGGIDDNQGIDSFILAEDRLRHQNTFGYDLYMTCDVSSNYTSGYNLPQENKKSLPEKLSLVQYFIGILLLTAAAVTGIITQTFTGFSFSILGITSVLLILSVYLAIKAFFIYQRSVRNENTFGIIILKHIYSFIRLRLSALIQLIGSRITSSVYLSAVIFPKKIRRISYDRLFEKITEIKFKTDGTEWQRGEDESLVAGIKFKHWRQFSLMNAIYLLSPKNDYQRIADLKAEPWYKENLYVTINGNDISLVDLLMPSMVLQETAQLAADTDVTLWYDQFQQQDNRPAAIVAAGQFTTCYTLLRYAFRFDSSDPYWSDLQQKLIGDWIKFNQSPLWMHVQLSVG